MKTKTLRKSILAFCIIAAMIFSFVPAVNPAIATVDAATVVAQNQLDDKGFKFTLYDDGTATITGYNGVDGVKEKNLVFPSTYTVKGVGDAPDTVYNVTIVQGFNSDNNVESMVIPEGVKEIKSIQTCSNLKSIKLPESLEKIGDMALYRCTSLEAVHIPANVKTIGSYGLIGCFKLDVTVAEGNTAFKEVDGVLYTADMKKVVFVDNGCTDDLVIPDTVTEIATQVFKYRDGVKNVVLPDSLTQLEECMFEECYDLETVKLPAGITAIPNNIFNKCPKLKSVEIPEGVTTIGGLAFADCASLTELKLPSTLTSITGLRNFAGTALQHVVIPDGVTDLPRRVFQKCTSLVSVTIPPSVTTIHAQAFQNVDMTKVAVIAEEGSVGAAFAKDSGAEVINYVAPVIKTESLPNAAVGTEYSQKLEADGYPVPEFSVVQGALPEGMSLAADGTLSGTPAEAGVYTFTVKAYNMGTDTQELTLTVEEAVADVPGEDGDDAEKNDKDNKDDATQTGDDANMASMFALMIAALITAGAAVIRRSEN